MFLIKLEEKHIYFESKEKINDKTNCAIGDFKFLVY